MKYSHTETITVSKDKLGSVRAIKRACDTYKMSFSAICVEALIDYFENGKFSAFVDIEKIRGEE